MTTESPAVVFLCLQEGVEVRVARIFNTFGSRMHMNDGRVVSNFILQALQGEPLTVRMLSLVSLTHTEITSVRLNNQFDFF